MRSLLLLLVILPVSALAQINRSAKELATERIQEYITGKLFRNMSYKAVSFGELKATGNKKSAVAWTIEHRFEISEGGPSGFEKTEAMQKLYKFLFYLDEKMKVVRAETYYSTAWRR